MRKLHQAIIFFLAVGLICCYERLDQENQILNYYEENSQYPIFHMYYNKHFSRSRQFEDFLDVLEETEYRNHDYARFLLTDCENVPQGQAYSCDNMRRTKDNRMIVGYYPSAEFINYGGKLMQNPPLNRQYTHPSDVYTVEEIQSFIGELMPNFFKELNSKEEYDEWLEPLYSPNIIFASREEEIPEVLIRLGVHYFLKFQFGFVSDLTESVINELNITSYPTLLVLKYNFATGLHEVHKFDAPDFSFSRYEEIKAFLEPLALKQQRNDLLFHKMKMPQKTEVSNVDDPAELAELLDRANGWALISQSSGHPAKLLAHKEKYGRFFEYYNLINSQTTDQTLRLYDPEKKRSFDLIRGDIQFKALNKDEFLSNTSIWLSKSFTVIGVRESYGYFCTLALSSFFRGLTHCLIVKEQDYEATSKALNMEFEIGFICAEKIVDGVKKITGQNFKNTKYEDVYLTSQYTTRLKSKEIIDNFLDQPIKPIEGTDKIAEICAFPTKKCALLFTHPKKKDRTAYDYLKDVAKNYINEYQFYEIDLSCNTEFSEEIESLEKQGGGLVVFHPRSDSYVYLKAKLSKTTFERFLKANLGDSKKLPLRKFLNPDIKVNACKNAERKQKSSL